MHLLIPFAAALSDAGRQAAASLQLPHLKSLLARMAEVDRDSGDERSASPPHERVLAQALGLQGGDGLLPWAARAAQADGIATGQQAWGLLTPAHWLLGTDQVSLLDPALLLLDDAASRALFDAVQPLFTSDGFALHYAAPLRWYAAHDSLAALATASLDRVIGRNVDAWLGTEPAARRIRRLQSEVQMLLHSHPLNDARQARGLLPVNSFWLSGCGVAQPANGGSGKPPQVDDRLRAPALADDWSAWVKAWQTLDDGPLAAAQSASLQRLTLCGERGHVSFVPAAPSLRKRLRGLWSQPPVPPLLQAL